jgi:hypothetical protein
VVVVVTFGRVVAVTRGRVVVVTDGRVVVVTRGRVVVVTDGRVVVVTRGRVVVVTDGRVVGGVVGTTVGTVTARGANRRTGGAAPSLTVTYPDPSARKPSASPWGSEALGPVHDVPANAASIAVPGGRRYRTTEP